MWMARRNKKYKKTKTFVIPVALIGYGLEGVVLRKSGKHQRNSE